MYIYHNSSITDFVGIIESETLAASKQVGGIQAVSLRRNSKYIHPYIARHGWVCMCLDEALLRYDYDVEAGQDVWNDEMYVECDIYPINDYLKAVEVHYATHPKYVGDEDLDFLVAMNTEIIPNLESKGITVSVPAEIVRLQSSYSF